MTLAHFPRDALRLVRHRLGHIRPRMTSREVECYKSLLANCARLVEYGVGGSTVLACSHAVPHITAVESDPDWIEKVRNNRNVRDAEKAGRLALIYADIGPVGRQGRPADRSKIDDWPRYASAPWNANAPPPDLVLIDGRFRVACAMQALLNGTDDTMITIHDFFSRPKYHVVRQFADLVTAIDDLAVFRRCRAFDEADAREVLTSHVRVWD